MHRTYGIGQSAVVDRRVVYPPKARVSWVELDPDDESDLVWFWSVGHYEDSLGGGRTHHMTRWGACTRWDDALEIALAMQRKEQAAYWARIIAQVDAKGIVLPDE